MASALSSWFSKFPFITVTGPRGSGKTTLCRETFPNLAYADLEMPEQRQFAAQDPRGFLTSLGDRAIIDEISRAPELLPYLHVDAGAPRRNGRYILTSSENLEIIRLTNESLPSSNAMLCLLPLTLDERKATGSSVVLNDVLFSGFFPRIHEQPLDPRSTLSDYFGRLVERDIPRMGGVRDRTGFERFTRICAGRIGRTLDLVAIGRDAGVSHTTARNWFRVLEASYIAFRLPPVQANTSKRIVKSPKLYFYDVGLATYLLGIEVSDQITTHPLKGALFENMVVVEALKSRFNYGKPSNLTFFLDNHGLECELLSELQTSQAAIEIRSSATIPSDAFESLRAIERALPATETKSIVYGGTERQFRNDVEIVPFDSLSEFLRKLEADQSIEPAIDERIGLEMSTRDLNRLDDVYTHAISPLIQSLTTSMAEFETVFESISQLEFVEYGQNQVISPMLFSSETWESTKLAHLEIALDELSEKSPLTLVHQVTLTGISSTGRGELATEVRCAWTLSNVGLEQWIAIDGAPKHHLGSELVGYEEVATFSSPVDQICSDVRLEIRERVEKHIAELS